MRFTIEQVQTVIFLSSVDMSSLLKIATYVAEKIPGLSGADPTIIPKQAEVPPEFPHIQMKNDNTGWNFHFGPVRCDFFFTPVQRQQSGELLAVLKMIEGPILGFWEILQKELAARSPRLALVVAFSSETENAAEEIRQRYLNTGYSQGAKEILVNYRLNPAKDNFQLNHWTRIRNREAQQGVSEAIHMLVDVNTVVEMPLDNVDTTIIQEFLEIASNLILETVNLHSEST